MCNSGGGKGSSKGSASCLGGPGGGSIWWASEFTGVGGKPGGGLMRHKIGGRYSQLSPVQWLHMK